MKESRKGRFKVAVLGEDSSGKTSLLKKYFKSLFNFNSIDDMGVSFYKYDVMVSNIHCFLQMWDISNSDCTKFLIHSYYTGNNAAIIVFTLNKEKNLRRIEYWCEDIKYHCGDIPIVLLRNDLNEHVKNSDDKYIQDIVRERSLLGYYKASDYNGNGIFDALHDLIVEILHRRKITKLPKSKLKEEIVKNENRYLNVT